MIDQNKISQAVREANQLVIAMFYKLGSADKNASKIAMHIIIDTAVKHKLTEPERDQFLLHMHGCCQRHVKNN